MSNVYESDFYAWAMEQAALLRERRLDAADIDNIAEEIESMGRGEMRELVDRLAVLLLHLLKWRFQPKSSRTELERHDPRAAPEASRPPRRQPEPESPSRRGDGSRLPARRRWRGA